MTSSFVGRERELAQIRALLARDRIVTIVAPGGMGKSRLAREFALRYGGEFAGGVRELRPADVESGAELDVEGRDALVLLDDAETALDTVAHWLATFAVDGPHFLVTSRAALNAKDERVFSLGPLDEPARLFVDRALEARPDLKLTGKSTTLIADVCRRLGGIPLAIELAAGQIAALAPANAAPSVQRFDEHLSAYEDEPEATPHAGANQHRSLTATLEWSHRALIPDERRLFALLGVFAGSFTLRACHAIAGDSHNERQTAALLDGLVGKALVKCTAVPEGPRFALHPVVREYALRRLERDGGAAAIRKRFCDYYCEFARELWTHDDGPLPDRIARTTLEWENVRAALRTTLDRSGNETLGAETALALDDYWIESGRLIDGRYWLLSALEVAGPGPLQDALAYRAAVNAHGRGDFTELENRCRHLVAIYETEDRAIPLARALNGLANARYRLGDPVEAEAIYRRALGEYRRGGDRPGEGIVLMNLGALYADRLCDFPAAREFCLESLRIFSEEEGVSRNVGTLLANIAEIDSRMGHHERAIEYAAKSRSVFEQLGNEGLAAWQLLNAAQFNLELREFARSFDALRRARPALHEGLLSAEHTAAYYDIAFMLAAEMLSFELAAKLYGYSEQFRSLNGMKRSPSEAMIVEPRYSLVRNALRDEKTERLAREGTALDDAAVDAAIDALAETPA